FNCYKIAGYSQEYDVQRVMKVLDSSVAFNLSEEFLAEYRTENIIKRFQVIVDELNQFFDHKIQQPSNIKSLTKIRMTKLLAQRIYGKVRKKYFHLK
ncbi:MAG: glycosyltransferase, partial [Nostoc sp.]